jgi:hypothetical protein
MHNLPFTSTTKSCAHIQNKEGSQNKVFPLPFTFFSLWEVLNVMFKQAMPTKDIKGL